MTEMLNVAEAKRRFSELIDRVGNGERFIVARRGKPVLALVPPALADRDPHQEYVGFAALAGALADWPDFAEMMDEVVASRRHARDREVPYFD